MLSLEHLRILRKRINVIMLSLAGEFLLKIRKLLTAPPELEGGENQLKSRMFMYMF